MPATKKPNAHPEHEPNAVLVAAVESYLSRYVSFPAPDYAFAGALWAAATHMWPEFDAFPYLVITSETKRSGKTRLSELLSFLAANPMSLTAVTAAAVFRSIEQESPTLFIDEAETLSSEEASDLRAALNTGYRRGQTVARASGGSGIVKYNVFCPKVFVLIGDVYDTLRDRSIVLRLRRGEPSERFVYRLAEAAGSELRMKLSEAVAGLRKRILDRYERHEGLPFLPDRDEEIWTPLFCICEALAPHRLTELQRVAVDLATEKTAEARRYIKLLAAEQGAEQDEYAKRLLRDMYSVMNGDSSVYTQDAITRLRDLPTAPWRKFRGAGITDTLLADLLRPFGVEPALIRTGGKRPGARVARGYRKHDVHAALARNGLT